MNALKSILRGMGGMLVHPGRTAQAMAAELSIKPVAILVIVFGVLYAVPFMISYLAHDYPPPADELNIWVEHWGKGVMLPFFNVPAESYRGFQAAIMLPFAFALWILMGGSARLVASLFGGKQSYEFYLKITGLIFFTVWILSAFLDFLYSNVFWGWVAKGLQGEYGPFMDGLLQAFMPVEYIVLYGLVAVNITIATRTVEQCTWWKAALVGVSAFVWPMLLVSSVVR